MLFSGLLFPARYGVQGIVKRRQFSDDMSANLSHVAMVPQVFPEIVAPLQTHQIQKLSRLSRLSPSMQRSHGKATSGVAFEKEKFTAADVDKDHFLSPEEAGDPRKSWNGRRQAADHANMAWCEMCSMVICGCVLHVMSQ
jgi:hypothetical protein